MILQALLAYADREHLGDAATEEVAVRWLIPVVSPGRLAGAPVALCEDPAAKRPQPKRMRRPFTSPNELNQGDKSHFLCDNLGRVALLPNSTDTKDRSEQHAYFISLLLAAAAACPGQAGLLRILVSFLRDEHQLSTLRDQLVKAGAAATDLATFSVDGDVLLDDPEIIDYWRTLRGKSVRAGTRALGTCVATGQWCEILDTHEKIKGVPGAGPMGANLISFDKESFRSYGLEQARNAPLSVGAELGVRSALEALLRKSKRQQLNFGGATFIHWTRQASTFDPTDLLVSADPEAIAHLLAAPIEGRFASPDTNAYYACVLSGNGARIVVRDWLECTVAGVEAHLAAWFSDLRTVEPDGLSTRAAHKLFALIAAALPSKEGRADFDKMPPQWPAALTRAALTDASIPDSILSAAIRRQQLEADGLNPARAALIKLALTRRPNPNLKEAIVPEQLDPALSDRAYLCGRLFATLARLQFLALGEVNAGIIERFYASASITPSLVMGRLLRNAQFHLAKAGGGAAENVRKEIEAIATAIGPAFPTTLDLEDQGRFGLGYYQQRADYRRRSAERAEAAATAQATA